MKGIIQNIDVKNGVGIIQGNNKGLYKFDIKDWTETSCYPVKGMVVTYEVDDSFSAYDIIFIPENLIKTNYINLPKKTNFLIIFLWLFLGLLSIGSILWFSSYWLKYKNKEAVFLSPSPNIESIPSGLIKNPEGITDYASKKEANILLIQPVIKKFTALRSRLDIGLNFSEYVNYVGDLKVILDELKSEPYIESYDSYQYLNHALNDYMFAITTWKYSLSQRHFSGWISSDDKLCEILIKNYGARTSKYEDIVSNYISIDEALSAIWSKASENIAAAKNSLH